MLQFAEVFKEVFGFSYELSFGIIYSEIIYGPCLSF